MQESLAETGERPLVSPQANSISHSSDIVNIDNELSLIVVRASGGSATAQIADAHISARVAVGAFEIEDLLVGSRCAALGYLARSFQAGTAAVLPSVSESPSLNLLGQPAICTPYIYGLASLHTCCASGVLLHAGLSYRSPFAKAWP